MTTTTTTFQDDATQRPPARRHRTPPFSIATAAASPRSRPLSTSYPTYETSLPTVDVTPLTEDITLPSGSTPIRRRYHLLLNALFISRLFTLTARRASTTGLTLPHTSSDSSTIELSLGSFTLNQLVAQQFSRNIRGPGYCIVLRLPVAVPCAMGVFRNVSNAAEYGIKCLGLCKSR